MQIKTFTFSAFGTNTYVITFPEVVLLVDPACSDEYERQVLLNYIRPLTDGSQKRVLVIIATHGHLDHLWGAAWATKQWDTSVRMHEADIPYAEAMQRQYDLFGIPATPQPFPIEEIHAAIAQHQPCMADLQILHTPGHTPGSVCLYWPAEKILLSGDTLFCHGYGRTDLPGGDPRQMLDSLRKLTRLPEDVLVYPGHGDTTTIGDEKW